MHTKPTHTYTDAYSNSMPSFLFDSKGSSRFPIEESVHCLEMRFSVMKTVRVTRHSKAAEMIVLLSLFVSNEERYDVVLLVRLGDE